MLWCPISSTTVCLLFLLFQQHYHLASSRASFRSTTSKYSPPHHHKQQLPAFISSKQQHHQRDDHRQQHRQNKWLLQKITSTDNHKSSPYIKSDSSSRTLRRNFIPTKHFSISPNIILSPPCDDNDTNSSLSSSSSSFDTNNTSDASAQKQQNKTTTSPPSHLYDIPPTTTITTSTLPVSPLHTLSYTIYNHTTTTTTTTSPRPLTALFLHGGPGAGSFPNHARFFSPSLFSIVVCYDQRGAGRSVPRGDVRDNDLNALVSDVEVLRRHVLGEEKKWDVIVGGSWGVTLALAYAIEYPTRVGALVLRGVCCMRREEIDWLFGDDGGAGVLEREGWKEFASLVKGMDEEKKDDGRNVLRGYHKLLMGDDEEERALAAYYWFNWERRISSYFFGNEERLSQELEKWRPWEKRRRDDDDSNGTLPSLLHWDGSDWTLRYDDDGMNEEEMIDSNDGTSTRGSNQNPIMSDYLVHQLLRRFDKTPLSDTNKTNDNAILSTTTNNTTSPSTTKPQLPPQFKNMTSIIPAQSMLTCHYSLNNAFMNATSRILNSTQIDRIRHIPCIAIHGGLDVICPPDTVIDLHRLWPEMEVRFVLKCGHSMYEGGIAKGVVEATNWFGRERRGG